MLLPRPTFPEGFSIPGKGGRIRLLEKPIEQYLRSSERSDPAVLLV